MKSPFLFVPSGEHVAHNLMNFGNFLWGATGYITGIPTFILQLGAHYNSIMNPSEKSYMPQFDSADDQISIGCGISYAQKHNFKKITHEEN